MKTIVVYKSKYGTSKQYALWLSEALNCKAEPINSIRIDTLLSYNVIIYVGGLYAGRVSGFKKIEKHLNILKKNTLILCMVGMTSPAEQDKYQQIFMNNVPVQYRSAIKPFVLRGDQLFSKMSIIHRLMMNMPKSMTEKIPVEQRTADDKHFLEHFGEDIYYSKQENINDIIAYVGKINTK